MGKCNLDVSQLERVVLQELKRVMAATRVLQVEGLVQNFQNELEVSLCHVNVHELLDAFRTFLNALKLLSNALPNQARFMDGADNLLPKLINLLKQSNDADLALQCAKLEVLLDHANLPGFYEYYLTLFTSGARSLVQAEDVDIQKLNIEKQINEYKKTHRQKEEAQLSLLQLKYACQSYQAYLRLVILQEAHLEDAFRECKEIELGEKRPGANLFETKENLWFKQQLAPLRSKGNGHSLSLALKKYDEMTRLCHILRDENQSDYVKWQRFKRRFACARPLLEKSRDGAVLKFIKQVVRLLSLGIAGCFAFFRVHGADFSTQAQKYLDHADQGLFRRREVVTLRSAPKPG